MKPVILAAAVVASATLAVPASAKTNLLVLMDASNSMWGQVDGVAKIEIAKSTVGGILSDLPQDTNIGLMAYGHTTKNDCGDVELLAPIGPDQAGLVSDSLKNLTPTGKTPIAASLQQGASAFKGLEGSKSIVLISDGVETCDGDACAAATALSAEGVDVRIHVVGFDLTEEERLQLECIADNGKGRYFNAGDTKEFAEAVADAVGAAREEPVVEEEPVLVAQNETTTDAAPTRTSVWVDDFSGFDLSEEWTVNGPNPENYIVEEDVLLMLSSRDNNFTQPEAENLVQLVEGMPRGNWDIEISFFVEMQTGFDWLEFGLMKDAESSLSSILWTSTGHTCFEVFNEFRKVSRGEVTNFKPLLSSGCSQDDWNLRAMQLDLLASEGATLTISKRGRGYTTALAINGWNDADGNQIVVNSSELTSLRSPGNLTMSVGVWNGDANGESVLSVDRVEIFEVE